MPPLSFGRIILAGPELGDIDERRPLRYFVAADAVSL